MPRFQLSYGAAHSEFQLNYFSSHTFQYPCNSNSQCQPIELNLIPGKYRFECWGSSGSNLGQELGGTGAYVSGEVTFKTRKTVYLYIGGKGNSTNGGYNGGGSSSSWARSGGGATDIRLTNGAWDNPNSLLSRIMVAGAGAGANDEQAKVGFGGLNGSDGSGSNDATCGGNIPGKGATQSKGGDGSVAGSFGKGGSSVTEKDGSGGGSGYFGGGKALGCASTGGGGSSFVSGYSECIAVSGYDSQGYPIMKQDSQHISGIIFTSISIIDGDQVMPSPSGSTETGHTGNGAVRITLLAPNNLLCTAKIQIHVSQLFLFTLFYKG